MARAKKKKQITKKTAARQKASDSINNTTRENLDKTPFSTSKELKDASSEIRKQVWTQFEQAKVFHELSRKEDYNFINKEFEAGLKCRYGTNKEHLVKVFSEGIGVEIEINEDLVKDIPQSSQYVESLIRSMGDTFSKSYYQAKGILKQDISMEDVIKTLRDSRN